MSEAIDFIQIDEYIVEISQGGPWLAQDGSIAIDWEKRGVWTTKHEAELALSMSLNHPNVNPNLPNRA